MKTTIKDYAINLYWDERAGYFVAEIPEIPTCAADGATQGEALANLEETFAVLKEAYLEEDMVMPVPDPALPVSVNQLVALSDIVKVARLAELAGIPGQTLATKLKRGTELTRGESRRIADALSPFSGALVSAHYGTVSAAKPAGSGPAWKQTDPKKYKELVKQNTPTRVIGLKLGRSESAVYHAASKGSVSLHPTNVAPVQVHESRGSYRVRRKD